MYGVGRIEILLSTISSTLLAQTAQDHQQMECAPAPISKAEEGYTDDELMTVDEACRVLNVARTTLTKLRKVGLLTTIEKGKAVRLLKVEVMAATRWYSVPKGKL